MNTPRKKQN